MYGNNGDTRERPYVTGEMPSGCTHRGFDVHKDEAGVGVIVRVTGALDAMIARILQRTLDRIDLTSLNRVELDIGALRFIDSAGLGLVASLEARCVAAGREFRVRPAPSALRHLAPAASSSEPTS